MGLATAIGAAVSIGGSLLANRSSNRATLQAAQVAQTNTATNNALARETRDMLLQRGDPFLQRGNAAGNQINAMLGIPTGGPEIMDFPQQSMQPNAMFGADGPMIDIETGMPIGVRDYGGFQAQGQPALPTAIASSQPTNPQAGFDAFRNSTGYQFRLNEGNRAIGANFAARGLNNSGAATRSAMRFGQDIASGEFGNYMNMLFNQQNAGLSGLGAVTGAQQNFANNTMANNNAGASVAANAALARGSNNALLYGNVAGALGNVFGSSFGFGR